MDDLANNPTENNSVDTTAPQGAPAEKPLHQPIQDKTETTICKPDQTPWWKVILECVAVAVGLGAVAIYGGQLLVMRAQLTEMQGSSAQTEDIIKAAQDSAAAAQDNADAAQQFADSAEEINSGIAHAVDKLAAQSSATKGVAKATIEAANTSKEAIRSSQRPYVVALLGQRTVEICQISRLQFPQGCAIVNYKNYGETPAFNVSVMAGLEDLTGKQMSPISECPKLGNEATIEKGGTGSCRARGKVFGGPLDYRVRGVIKYSDQFDPSKRWVVPFCNVFKLTHPEVADGAPPGEDRGISCLTATDVVREEIVPVDKK